MIAGSTRKTRSFATLAVVALCLLAGCSTLRGSHRSDVVVLMRIGAGDSTPTDVFSTLPSTTWTRVAVPASGLAGALCLLAPNPASGVLAPDARDFEPPGGWSRSWLRWPVELASTPEELSWMPSRLADRPSRRNLHLAAFDAPAFSSKGQDWIDTLPSHLRPQNTPWIVIDLPEAPPSTQTFEAAGARATDALVRWFGPGIEAAQIETRLAPTSIVENLLRLESGRALVPIEASAAELSWPGYDLWIHVQGGDEIEFVDLEVRTPDGILDRRAIGFEDIDSFADDGPGVQKMQVAVSTDGDAAVYSLDAMRQGVWLRTLSEFRAGGILGVPFFSGPSGRSLGIRQLQITPGSREFYRVLSPRPPDPSAWTHLAAGIHLWLVPRTPGD